MLAEITLYVTIAAGLLSLCGPLLLRRVDRCEPPARPRRRPTPSVSLIIPARDEAANIGALLESVAVQTMAPAELIVADDGSSDDTAERARAAGARVLTVAQPRPAGWAGKPWGCYSAARQARGQLLVFVDADTRLEPDGLRRLVESYEAQGSGLLSVEPYHRVVRAHEQLSAFFNVVRAASVRAFGWLHSWRRPVAAFGPCIAIDRGEYLASGGHARPEVRGQVLENLVLGQSFVAEGRPVRCYGGAGTIAMRMYPGGLGELSDGWAKAFAIGAQRTDGSALALSVVWLTSGILATAALASALTAPLAAPLTLGLAALAYLGFAAQLQRMLRQLGSFSPLTALLYPLPLLAFLWIFTRSAVATFVRGKVSWKGRAIEVARDR